MRYDVYTFVFKTNYVMILNSDVGKGRQLIFLEKRENIQYSQGAKGRKNKQN
jgi:hypothetical protein